MRVEVVVIRECLWKKTKKEKKKKKLQKDLKICERLSIPFCGFVESLIKHDNHSISETHLITSIVQHIVTAVKRGKAMLHKHSVSSTRGTWPNRFYEIIVIARKLGHCILCNSLCDMGVTQIYCSLISLKKGNILPLQSPSVDDAVWTFWREGQFSYHLKTC